jgi:hypothetical protein
MLSGSMTSSSSSSDSTVDTPEGSTAIGAGIGTEYLYQPTTWPVSDRVVVLRSTTP